MSAEPLSFYYDKKSPLYKRTDIVISNTPGDIVIETYVSSPIYNYNNVIIGYRNCKLTTHQIGEKQYEHIEFDTFNITDQGSITIIYSAINQSSTLIYPLDQQAATNIVSTTGKYFGLNGSVTVFTKSDGSRYVNISFFV